MKSIFFLTLLICVTLLIQPVIAQEESEEPAKEESAVTVKEIEPYFYAALEMTGSYEQHEQAFQTLYEQANSQGVPTDQPPFGVYYDNPETTPEEELKWEIGLPLPQEKKVKEPLKRKKWDYTAVATLDYTGPWNEEMADAYLKIFGWIEQNGYYPVGPVMEVYLGQPTQNEKGEWSGTVNIMVPVSKAE